MSRKIEQTYSKWNKFYKTYGTELNIDQKDIFRNYFQEIWRHLIHTLLVSMVTSGLLFPDERRKSMRNANQSTGIMNSSMQLDKWRIQSFKVVCSSRGLASQSTAMVR